MFLIERILAANPMHENNWFSFISHSCAYIWLGDLERKNISSPSPPPLYRTRGVSSAIWTQLTSTMIIIYFNGRNYFLTVRTTAIIIDYNYYYYIMYNRVFGNRLLTGPRTVRRAEQLPTRIYTIILCSLLLHAYPIYSIQ